MKARGTSKLNDKELISQAADIKTGFWYTPDDTINIDNRQLNVTFNPYVHVAMNTLGSIAVVTSTGDVFVDNTFKRLSDNAQSFVLHHEMGHVTLKHNGGPAYQLNRLMKVLSNHVLDIELEADKWAMDHVGKDIAIQGLKEMRSLTIDPISRREITFRINALNK